MVKSVNTWTIDRVHAIGGLLPAVGTACRRRLPDRLYMRRCGDIHAQYIRIPRRRLRLLLLASRASLGHGIPEPNCSLEGMIRLRHCVCAAERGSRSLPDLLCGRLPPRSEADCLKGGAHRPSGVFLGFPQETGTTRRGVAGSTGGSRGAAGCSPNRPEEESPSALRSVGFFSSATAA